MHTKQAKKTTKDGAVRQSAPLRWWGRRPVVVLGLMGSVLAATVACAPSRLSAEEVPRRSEARGAPQSATFSSALRRKARRLARDMLVIDGHIDLPMRLDRSRLPSGRLGEDVSRRSKGGDFDCVRARQGGLDAPFMSIYVEPRQARAGRAFQVAERRIDIVKTLIERVPRCFAWARSPDELVQNVARGRIALPMGIENGSALMARDLTALRRRLQHFHRRGIRYITLAHNEANRLSDSSGSRRKRHGGLSALGQAAVREMNRLGIMVDVSHLSEDAFWQVLQVSQKPVIASHSSCRAFTPGYARNLSDSMIRALAAQGGVAMVSFGSAFLDAEASRDRRRFLRARSRMMRIAGITALTAPQVRAWEADYKARTPMRWADVTDVAKHIDHIIRLVGEDHVGLGSDFEGVGDSTPRRLKDVAALPNLWAALLARGYTRQRLEKIASGNLLRVWRAVARVPLPIHARPLPFTRKRAALTVRYRAVHYGHKDASVTITPRAIVLHWTALPSAAEAWARMAPDTLPPERAAIAKAGALNVSAHFLVDRDGRIEQLLPVTWMARHTIGLNHVAIGIENVGGAEGRDDLTDAQVRANAALIRHLVQRHPSIQAVFGHHEATRMRQSPLYLEHKAGYRSDKRDPGDRFMRRVTAWLTDWGYGHLRL
ncbi:MAG: membrane dipeptidase [Polyangiales bacterium]